MEQSNPVVNSFWSTRAREKAKTIDGALRLLFPYASFFCVYSLSIYLGQFLVPPAFNASVFWAPTGIALGGVLVFGQRVWPAIALGVFLVDGYVLHNLSVATSMAVGNTVEALLGAHLITKIMQRKHFSLSTGKISESSGAIALLLLAATVAPIFSATFGTVSQLLAHTLSLSASPLIWFTWWVENYLGILAVTPAILVIFENPPSRAQGAILEAILCGVLLWALGILVFGIGMTPLFQGYPLEYLLLPALWWAAFRFGIAGVSFSVFSLVLLATYGTRFGFGPLNGLHTSISVLFLQLFLISNSITAFFLAGILADRDRINHDLKNSNRDLEYFASMASHDLREPIRSIQGFSTLLSRRCGTKLDEEENEYLRLIISSSKRLHSLTGALLDYSRVHQQLDFKSTPLDAVLKSVLTDLSESVHETKATITFCPLPTVKCDQTLIALVFQNLVANAIKFHGENPPVINISCKTRERDHLFCVSDFGIGVSEAAQKNVFGFFQRAEHGGKPHPGVGLGLAICKRMIEVHGGQIWMTSKPSLGSNFYFTLPI
jgi:signal transduction histidine kinase